MKSWAGAEKKRNSVFGAALRQRWSVYFLIVLINYIKFDISIMSKGEEAENLQYGQGILISGFTTGKEDKGYLTAKGFADTMAIY